MSKISIIVPIYNVEKYLNKCIESIVAQTYKNLEIILVDDGSLDNCPQMCDEWAKKDERIKVIHKVNGGVSSARNAGLHVATGEYIQFVDSDDFLELDACETLFNNMILNDVDWCVANFKYLGLFIKQTSLQDFTTSDQGFALHQLWANHRFNALWNKLYKKNLLNDINFIDNQKYGEDFLFNCEYLKQCKKICYISKDIYNYVFVDSSAMNTFSEKYFSNLCIVVNYVERVLKVRYPDFVNFLNDMQNKSILLSFKNLILTNQLTNEQKRKRLEDYTSHSCFKDLANKHMSIKQKLLYTCLKHKCIKTLKLLYKLKK